MAKSAKTNKKISCPECNSQDIVKKGIRKNKLKKFQQYLCNNCNKVFSENNNKNKTYRIDAI